MAKRLIKRTAPVSAVDAPKPLPARGKEAPEPETTICKGPETEKVKIEHDICTSEDTCIFDVYRHGLCHNHYKLNQGFVFDAKQTLYVKPTKEKKK